MSRFEEAVLIKDWYELSTMPLESETHELEIYPENGHGYINNKETGDFEYLSTHTFYGLQFAKSTKLLQECGFNVILGNWDEDETRPVIISSSDSDAINSVLESISNENSNIVIVYPDDLEKIRNKGIDGSKARKKLRLALENAPYEIEKLKESMIGYMRYSVPYEQPKVGGRHVSSKFCDRFIRRR